DRNHAKSRKRPNPLKESALGEHASGVAFALAKPCEREMRPPVVRFSWNAYRAACLVDQTNEPNERPPFRTCIPTSNWTHPDGPRRLRTRKRSQPLERNLKGQPACHDRADALAQRVGGSFRDVAQELDGEMKSVGLDPGDSGSRAARPAQLTAQFILNRRKLPA